MRAEINGAASKTARLALLRRYGWGVPSEQAVLTSAQNAVTMLTQDEFVPFDEEHKARNFRLHSLPWPVEELRELGAATVTLRVTLSYFIEPTASRRGWRRRYSYASHGLRFELKTPTETTAQFLRRVNHQAAEEEEGKTKSSSGNERWLVGPQVVTSARCTRTFGRAVGPTSLTRASSLSTQSAAGGRTVPVPIAPSCLSATPSPSPFALRRKASTSTPRWRYSLTCLLKRPFWPRNARFTVEDLRAGMLGLAVVAVIALSAFAAAPACAA